jgi:gliding motility-associated-like protein
MKKILYLLCSIMFLVTGISRAQDVYLNIPDTVCMSTNNSTADQAKFVSMNAKLSWGQSSSARWTITTPNNTTADYTILYSDVNSTDKLTQLNGTQGLTIQFLTPGTYRFHVVLPRSSGAAITRDVNLVVVDCTMQTCNGGNAEMPGFSENFGVLPGNSIRKQYSPASAITYIYDGRDNVLDLQDNYYAVSKNTQLRPEWVSVQDHSGLTNGAMLVCNSDYDPRIFFQKEVDGLCRGAVYNFSAWLMNIDSKTVFDNTCVTDYKYAGVTFQILNKANTSQVLAQFKTHAVSMHLGGPQWSRYGGSFTVPSGVSDVIVRIVNDYPGGCGNDIAIDDIEFQYCSPVITAKIEGVDENLKEVLCEGAPTMITSTYTPATYFVNPEYQWEMSDDNGVTWVNVPYGTAQSPTLLIAAGELTATKTEAADYLFRVRVFESGSSSATCAAPSAPVKITILPMPTLYLTKSQVCEGAIVELQASGGFDYFNWKDLPTDSSAKRQIQLLYDTTIQVYGHILYGIGNVKECVDSNSVSIKVDDKPVVEIASSPSAVCVGNRITFFINEVLEPGTPDGADSIYWYKGPDDTGVLIGDYTNMISMQYTPTSIADTVFSVVVKKGVCVVASKPFIVKVTAIPAPPPGRKVVSCVDANPNGYFTMTRTAIPGTTGNWSIIGLDGPALEGVDPTTIDFTDYVSIPPPGTNPGARIRILTPGITAYLQWTVKATANTTCVGTAFDTLVYVPAATQAVVNADTIIQCVNENIFVMDANEPNPTATDEFAETGTWSVISGTVSSFGNINDPKTTVTLPPNVPQEVLLQWSISNAAGCTTSYDTVLLRFLPKPSAVIDTPITVCNTATSFDVNVTATSGAPTYYNIAAASTSAMPGFVPVPQTDITTWPVTVAMPTGVPAGRYRFLLTVGNDLVGCVDTIPFYVAVEAPAVDPTGVTVETPNICTTGTTRLTVTGGTLPENADGTDAGEWVWYEGACGTGTEVGRGETITVTVSATTTFYVRAESNQLCGVSNCASGVVTVWDAPTAAEAGPNQAHCNDSLFTMASNAASIGTGKWSLTRGAAEIRATDSTNIAAVITVHAGDTAVLTWTITNGVCVTADTVVLINYMQPVAAVAGTADTATNCNSSLFTMHATAASPATAQGTWSFNTGSTATLVNPADLHNPAAQINVPVGDSATAYWTVTNGTCTSIDSIKLYSYELPAQANAGADTIRQCMTPAFNMNAVAPNLSYAVGKWSVANGTATFPATDSSQTDVVVTVPNGSSATLYWTITNGTCSTRDSIYLVNYLMPDPANAGPDSLVHCNDSLFTMVATAASPAPATGKWSLYPGSAASLVNPADSTLRNAVFFLPAGDTATAIWTVTNGVCSNHDVILLKNYMAPVPANAGADSIRHCDDGVFNLTGNQPSPVATATGVWTLSNTRSAITGANTLTPTVTVPEGDSVVAYWTITNGTCTSIDSVKLVNYERPDTANAGPDQHQCDNPNFTMAANAPSVPTATGFWTAPAGSTAIIANPNSPTTGVTIPLGDSSMLFWTITNGVCVDTDTMWIVNNNRPNTADAGVATIEHCDYDEFVMTANSPNVAGATGFWTVVSPATYTIPAADVNNPTATFTVPVGTTVVMRWTITNLGCTTTDDITLINNEQPTATAAGLNQTRCDDGTAFVLDGSPVTITGAQGTWSITSVTGGTATIATGEEHLPAAHVTLSAGATAVLNWTIVNGICSDYAAVTLTNLVRPATANTGIDSIKHCNDSIFTMTANAPTEPGAWGKWTLSNTRSTLVPATDTSNPVAVIQVPAGDSVMAYWTITNGVCSTVDSVKLVNYMRPTAAAVPADMQQCMNDQFPVTANAPDVPNAIGTWTLIAGQGTFPAGDDHANNTTFTVTAGNSASFAWTITNGVCQSADTIRLYNYLQPVAADAGPDTIHHCNVPTFTMQAVAASPAPSVGKWSLYTGSAASLVNPADSTNPAAVFTMPAGDSATATWTVTNGVCFSSDRVLLINDQMPAAAAAGPDQQHCNDSIFTMAANAPGVASAVGKWTLSNTRASFPTAADTSNPLAVIQVPAGDSVVAYWRITNGICSTIDSVKLVNNMEPSAADAGDDQRQCNTPAFTMTANTPDVPGATGTWTLPTGTTATIAAGDLHKPNAVINVPVGISVTATWTITNGVCTSSDDVLLTNDVSPAPANAGPNQTHCNDSIFVMAGNAPTAGATGTWSLYPGSAAVITPGEENMPAAHITLLAGDTATATWTITNGSCTSFDTVFLRNNMLPEVADAGADQTHCNDSAFTLAAVPGLMPGSQGTWVVISGTTIAAADIHNPTAKVIVPAGTSAVLQWTLNNGTSCAGTPATVTLTNLGPVLGNTISADQVICAADAPAPLTGTATLSGGAGTFTYQWQISTTNATTGFTNVTNGTGGTAATYTPAGPMTADTTWFRRIVYSGTCVDAISNAVKIQLLNALPIVIKVPDPITVNCVQGRDYTTLFSTATLFSHAPYNGEALTITHTDAAPVTNGCETVLRRTWIATDRCGLQTSTSQVITVRDTSAPRFTTPAPANVTVNCDNVPAMVNLQAYDSCNGALGAIVPIEVRVNGSCANSYQLIRKWVAADACGNVSDTLRQIITVQDTTRPVFAGTVPPDVTVECNMVPAGITLTASDNCTAGTITATMKDSTITIPGSCAGSYVIKRIWRAADECGNVATAIQTITVRDQTAPVYTGVARDTTVDCDKVPAAPALVFTDNCNPNPTVTYTETKVNQSTTCTNNYQLLRRWVANDGCNTTTVTQTVTVQDTTRPVFTVPMPRDTTVSCGAVPRPLTTISANDNCGTVTVTFKETRENNTGACAGSYKIIRVYTATDNCRNALIHRQEITVVDTTRPVIDPAPANVTVQCGGSLPAAATLYATDNCDPNFPRRATMTVDPYTVDVCNGYTITRRWNIADQCNNPAFERVQIITVVACPKPQLDPALPMNCSDNTKFALQLANRVSKPKFTLQSVLPAGAVSTPLTQTSNVFDLRGATQATFIVTDGVTGCVSDPVTYDLQYIAKPTVDLGNDIEVCQGTPVTLDAGAANAGYTIRWNTGANTQQISVTTSGTYTATVSNQGCTTTASVKVTVNTPPVVNLGDSSICMGSSIRLNAYVEGAAYSWSTGETTPNITVNTAGTYTVDVTLKGCTVTAQSTIFVATPPVVELTPDTAICPGGSVTLRVEPDGGAVKWSDNTVATSISVTRPGTYWVTVSKNGCVVGDTVKVGNKANINFDLGPDKDICAGGLVVLDATHADVISYLWNDGTTNPVKEVSTPGKYIVTVLDRFCNLTMTDSVKVTVAGIEPFSLGNDTTICIGQTLTLAPEAGSGNSIRWQDGSSSPTFVVRTAGYYTVTISNECGSMSDDITVTYKECEGKPQFPNAFTPNGDGKNDSFKPHVTGTMFEYDLRIYNRWGEQIFKSNNASIGWDGRYHGTLVDVGTYVWMLSYKRVLGGPVNVVKGEVTVVR